MKLYKHDAALWDMEDERNSKCRGHGGVASIINCYECLVEYRDNEYDFVEEDTE
jgi:hypothetical protein